jgi:hypothetical protein
MTESLFFLLSVGTVYLAVCEKWGLAGIVGIGATATRLVGLILVPSLAGLWWEQRRRLSPAVAFIVLPVLGFAAFSAYLFTTYGDALGFLHAVSSYGRTLRWGGALLNYIRTPRYFTPWHFYPFHLASVIVAGLATAALIWRRNFALAIYLLGCIAVPLSVDLASMTRYAMASFPIFIGISYLTENDRVDWCIRAVCISLMAVMSLACGFHFGLAMD